MEALKRLAELRVTRSSEYMELAEDIVLILSDLDDIRRGELAAYEGAIAFGAYELDYREIELGGPDAQPDDFTVGAFVRLLLKEVERCRARQRTLLEQERKRLKRLIS